MTTLLIESNEKLAIKQMEFKLVLKSRAQAQTTQLAIPKTLNDSNIYHYVILCKEAIQLIKNRNFHLVI